jgi:hypothetical protein
VNFQSQNQDKLSKTMQQKVKKIEFAIATLFAKKVLSLSENA